MIPSRIVSTSVTLSRPARQCFLLATAFLWIIGDPASASARHDIGATLVSVVQHATNNTAQAVTTTSVLSINGLRVRGGSNRGDVNLQAGDDYADDLASGVMLGCIAENGRDNGETAFPGTNHCTSTVDYSRSGGSAGAWFLSTFNAPLGAEYNIHVAAAHFPYGNWLGGLARNSGATNGGSNDLFTGSPLLQPGTHFIELGNGRFIVDLRPLGIHSTNDGVLLVTHAKNEDNYASSFADPITGTWTLLVKDNGTDGTSTEQDPVAFVFVPRTNNAVISGRFRGDGAPLMFNGPAPAFTVTNIESGNWRLRIPGQTPGTGVLLISGEAGSSLNTDNIVSYSSEAEGWVIQSRDLPGNPPPLQTPGNEPVASFVFIPSVDISPLFPPDGSASVGASPELAVRLPSLRTEARKVTFLGRQIARVANTNADFTIVTLPDTQFYTASMNGGAPAMFQAQTDWIVANRTNLNIVFVTHLGDITQRGQNGGNPVEWLAATNAMYRLENPSTTLLASGIPYGMGVGNHDQSPIGGGPSANTSFFNQFFGVQHFIGYDYYGGHFGENNNNSFQFFSAGGLDFIALHFEYDTSANRDVLAWADELLKAHPGRRAIATSHWIVNTGFDATFSAQGRAIFDALRTHANFFMMLCGHIAGEGQRTDRFNGRSIYSFLSDYQARAGGGNGWLRYYTFSPSNNVIRAHTFSPWLNQHELDADSRFTVPYDMTLPGDAQGPFEVLGSSWTTNDSAVCPWPALPSNADYEWYVAVEDGSGASNSSPVWRFHTSNVMPSTINQSLAVPGDAATELSLAAFDSNDDALEFQISTHPRHGMLKTGALESGRVTYIPIRGYRGADRFTYVARDGLSQSPAASMNILVTAPPDGDGDQMPDDWEAAYSLSEPDADPDGDGASNLQEYRANTDPVDPASVLRISSVHLRSDRSVELQWDSAGGVRYRVQFNDGTSNSFLPGSFTDAIRSLEEELEAGAPGERSTMKFVDDGRAIGPSPSGSRVYRLRVVE